MWSQRRFSKPGNGTGLGLNRKCQLMSMCQNPQRKTWMLMMLQLGNALAWLRDPYGQTLAFLQGIPVNTGDLGILMDRTLVFPRDPQKYSGLFEWEMPLWQKCHYVDLSYRFLIYKMDWAAFWSANIAFPPSTSLLVYHDFYGKSCF